MFEMDSWPWAQAGSTECVALTVGCIRDMSGPGDRGLLTAGAHGHTRTAHHPNCSTDGEVGMLGGLHHPGPLLSPQGPWPKTRRTPPMLFCLCLLQLHPTTDVPTVVTRR